ncbi:type II toxin-antitoxin system RelB/DinJ family antitoxin [Selenomonas sp.]|uniref:type II toxin-antitoxin system RelB/DinJ family antitoxin n=1 Tax=Selenomonas sp. TaxID=2053611 RepID=UPI003FA2E6A7
MAQTTFSVRMEEGLKRQFEGLCQEFGMNMATAIHVFVRAVVRERRIPFEISSETELTREGAMQAFMNLRQEAKRSGAADMTLEEINREIAMARQGAGR